MSKAKKSKKGGAEDEGYSQEAYLASLETRLPGGKKTKRLPVLKLELGDIGGHEAQMNVILKKVYGMDDDIPLELSREFQDWRQVDQTLYGDAKKAYDGVIEPFKKQPRVYKLESIREKVWEGTRDKTAENEEKAEREYQERKKKLDAAKKKMAEKKSKAAKAAMTNATGAAAEAQKQQIMRAEEAAKKLLEDETPILPPLTKDEQLRTHLNPFEPPAPWVKEKYKGEMTYFNQETLERSLENPTFKNPDMDLWRVKLQMLEQLTPRDDLDGFQYREVDQERRRRQRAMTDFDKSMQEEIRRRQEEPNDLEQIEDVLFDMVDGIVKREEKEMKIQKKKEKKAQRDAWHIMCQGYRMKDLPSIENDDGEIDRKVCDLDFINMIISWTGHTLSLQTPPGFFEGHDSERADAKVIEDERLRMIEYEKNRPFVEKAKIVLALARNDPNKAASKVYQGMKDTMLAPYRRFTRENRQKAMQDAKRITIQSIMALLKASQTPKESALYAMNRLNEFYQKTFFIESEQSGTNEELEALLNELEGKKKVEVVDPNAETEAQKKLRLWKASQPKPVKHADCVLVTMTFLVEPPAPWKWKKPRTWKDDVDDAKEMAREKAQEAKWKLMPLVPKVVDNLNEVGAQLGVDAIELNEEEFEVPVEVVKRKPLKPWEVRDRHTQSNRTSRPKKPSNIVSTILGISPVKVDGPPNVEVKVKKLRRKKKLLRIEEGKEGGEGEGGEIDDKEKSSRPSSRGSDGVKAIEPAKKTAKSSENKSKSDDIDKTVATEGSKASKTKSISKKVKALDDAKAADATVTAATDALATATASAEAADKDKKGEVEDKQKGEELVLDEDGTIREIPQLTPMPTNEVQAIDPMALGAPSVVTADNIYELNRGANALTEEERTNLYLESLRNKKIEDDPEAYDRIFSIKIPGIPKLSNDITISVPTTTEVADKMRDSLRRKLEPKYERDIMDPTERKNFERMIIEELSEAICLPAKNISIEEIRRLEKNDAKLVALDRRNREYQEMLRQKAEDEEEERLAERERRRDYNNPATYDDENWAIENLRDFVEDTAERLGYDPDETVEKFGLRVEDLKLKRFDKMEMTEEGEFLKLSDTMMGTRGSNGSFSSDFDFATQQELMRVTDLKSTLLSTHLSTMRFPGDTPEEKELAREQAAQDYQEVLDVYDDICDKLQVEEDARLAVIEAQRIVDEENARSEAQKLTQLMRITINRTSPMGLFRPTEEGYSSSSEDCRDDLVEYPKAVLVDVMWEMQLEVVRRDVEESQISRDLEDMYRADMETRHPGEVELVDVFVTLLQDVQLRVEEDERLAIEAEIARVAKEKFDFENEFNWEIHPEETHMEKHQLKGIQAMYGRRTQMPQKPAYFKLGLSNPAEIMQVCT